MRTLALTLLAATALTVPAFALPVTAIKVAGNLRVEAQTVAAYLPFKVGDEFTAEETGTLIRSLYATGLFANVELSQAPNGEVLVTVVENPMVNKVVFEGNDAIVDERLRELVQLQPRSIYSPAKIQQDVQTLQAAYRSRGRFTTVVDAQLIEREQNRVDIIYKITESAKTKIADINFVGNSKISDGDLGVVITTRPSAWWRFMSMSDSYDPTRLEVDKELLRKYYLANGYADVQITSAVAEITRDSNEFILTYTIYEGPRYDFGAIDVALKAEAEGLDMSALKDTVTLKTGDMFDASRIEKTESNLIDALGNKGFAFLNVEPSYQKDEANRTVGVTFNITPGPRVYVNRINVEGNDRTLDKVIRREMRLAEGDVYSASKLKRSKDRLTYLSFFENVDVSRSETPEPDRMDINVKVKEQSTGEFNVGAGFSTYDGLLATADLKERNFLGKGQEIGVKFALSQRKQDFNIGFTEPYFLGQELAAGVDAFNEKTDVQDESSYDTARTGGALRLKFPLDEYTSNGLRLGYKETKIENVGTAASQFVAREAGKRNSVSLANTYAFDNRDSYLTPTRGYRLSLTGEYSGFGSDINYLRGTAQGSWHKEVVEDWVLSLGSTVGAISDFGEDLPIYEHFTGGGRGLRGFEYGGIGPRDSVTGDALGGKYMMTNNAEVSFPLTNAFNDLGIRGLFFVDGGIVKSFEGATSLVTDSDTYRIAAGTGIFWRSPIGPLRLEFGFPLVKADEDRDQIFSFSVGSSF